MQQRLDIRQAQRFQFISKSTEVDCPQGRFARFLRGGTTLGAFVFERVSDLGYAGSGHAASRTGGIAGTPIVCPGIEPAQGGLVYRLKYFSAACHISCW